MTPSNTDTELRDALNRFGHNFALMLENKDNPEVGETYRAFAANSEEQILALIARRDTEKREALLKAVGELTPFASVRPPAGGPDDYISRYATRQVIESIYRGTQQ